MYHHIMVPIDGSTQANMAFYKAVIAAKEMDASLLIVHIIDTRNYQSIITYDSGLAKEAKIDSEMQMKEFLDYALSHGVSKVETLIKFGAPKEEICYHLTKDYDIDYIIMGATGLNAFERLVLGSVSDYVIRHAPCDVTIVRT